MVALVKQDLQRTPPCSDDHVKLTETVSSHTPPKDATDKQCTWGINIVAMAIVDITPVCIFKDITITNKCCLRTGLFSMQCRSAVFLGEYSIVPSFWAFQPLSSFLATLFHQLITCNYTTPVSEK